MTRLKVDLLINAAHLPGTQALMNWAISPSCNLWDLCFVNGGNLSVCEATVICIHVIDEFCEWPLMSSIFQSAQGIRSWALDLFLLLLLREMQIIQHATPPFFFSSHKHFISCQQGVCFSSMINSRKGLPKLKHAGRPLFFIYFFFIF